MVIFNQYGQVLLLKRHADHKLFPSEWCLPGGKIDRDGTELALLELSGVTGEEYQRHFLKLPYGETPEEAIYRECKEEVGLKIYNFKNTGNTMMDDYYHMYVFEALKQYEAVGSERVFPNREHERYEFFSLYELPDEISKCTKEFLEAQYL